MLRWRNNRQQPHRFQPGTRTPAPACTPPFARRQFLLEPLEPRLLLSADSILSEVYRSLLDDAAQGPGRDFAAVIQQLDAAARAGTPAASVAWPADWRPDNNALVVADGSLAKNLGVSSDNLLVLDGNEDGVEQITQALAGRSGVTELHILTHGANGSLQLGSTTLDASSLEQHAAQLSAWGEALAPDADILLYACDLASGTEGLGFVEQFALLTGADIAASTDLTGSTGLGGDWELEYASGSTEAASIGTLLADLPIVLATVSYDAASDTLRVIGNTGAADHPTIGFDAVTPNVLRIGVPLGEGITLAADAVGNPAFDLDLQGTAVFISLGSASVQSLSVELGDGDDSLVFGLGQANSIQVTIDGGAGFDTVALNATRARTVTVDMESTVIHGAIVTTAAQAYRGSTVLNADIITAGGPITLTGNAVLGTEASVTLDTTGGGAVSTGAAVGLTGVVNDDVAGSTKLVLLGGTLGTVRVDGAVGSDAALAALIASGGAIHLNGGSITTTADQTYSAPVVLAGETIVRATTVLVGGPLNAGAHDLTISAREINLAGGLGSVVGSGVLTLQGQTDATPLQLGGIADSGSTTLDITDADIAALAGFAEVAIGRPAGTLTVDSSGASFEAGLALHGAVVTVHGELTAPALTVTGAAIHLSGGDITTSGNQTYNGAVTLDDHHIFAVTGAAGSISFATSLSAGAHAVTLAAREINLPAVADSVSGTGHLTLQPEADATPINVGGAADAGAGSLDITDSDIAALAGGFSQIAIGRIFGTAAVVVDTAAFGDSLVLRAPGLGGSLRVNGSLSSRADGDAASITLVGSGVTTTLNGDIVTAGAPITIADAIVVGAIATVTIDTTGNGSSAGADIVLAGTINDDVAGSSGLVVHSGSLGDATLGGVVGGSAALASMSFNGKTLNINGGGVTTASTQTYNGVVNLGAATVLRGTGTASGVLINTALLAGAHDLTIAAREINLPVIANSVSGTGTLMLEPGVSTVPVRVGAAVDLNTSTLDITSTDVAALADGFASIVIGSASGTSAATLTVAGAALFKDALVLRAPGATVNISASLSAGTATIDATAGAGTVVFSGSPTLTAGAFSARILRLSSAGTVTLDATTTADSVQLTAGNLAGSGDVTVTGTGSNWTSGTLSGSGDFTVGPLATLTIGGTSLKSLAGKAFVNLGTVRWVNDRIDPDGSSTWDNRGLFELSAPDALMANQDGVPGTIVLTNTGTIRQMSGVGRFLSGITVDNEGAVEVQAGRLELGGEGGTHTGSFEVAAGATLRFADGIHSFVEGSSLTAAGTLSVTGASTQVTIGTEANLTGAITMSGGTLTLDPAAGSINPTSISVNGSGAVLNLSPLDEAITPSSLTLGGGTTVNLNDATVTTPSLTLAGTLGGTSDVTLTGAGTWDAGTLRGPAQFIVGSTATLTIGGTSLKSFADKTFVNLGTVRWVADRIDPDGSSTWDNRGLFELSTPDAPFHGLMGNQNGLAGTIVLTNSGTIRQASGRTTFGSEVTLNQNGTVDVMPGATLRKTGGFENFGLLMGGGTVDVGSAIVRNSGIIRAGSSPGLLSITGNLTLNPTSVIDFELGGYERGTRFDALNVTGTASLAGTANISHVDGFVPRVLDTFEVIRGATVTGGFSPINTPIDVTYAPLATGTTYSLRTTTVTNRWATDASGDWHDATNWTLGVTPRSDQVVLIDRGDATPTITLSADGQVAGSLAAFEQVHVAAGSLELAGDSRFNGGLTLSGGALLGGGAIAVNSTFDWSGGSVGAGAPLTTGGATNITGSATLSGRGWNNQGTVNLSAASATAISSTGSFNNAGTFINGGSTPHSASFASFTSGGQIVIAEGALTLAAGEVEFNGGPDSVSGLGRIGLEPDAEATPIIVGGSADSPLTLDITDNDLAALASTLQQLTIGRPAGVHVISVDASGAVLKLATELRAQGVGGSITVSGPLRSGLNEVRLSASEVTLGEGSSLHVELAGTGSGQFTRYTISDHINLDGELNAQLANGFLPASNDHFEFMTFVSRAGEFAASELPADFVVDYGAQAVALVFAPNDAPVAQGDAYTTAEDLPLGVAAPGVLDNDIDDGDLAGLGAELVSEPAHGSVTLNTDGSFTYTPAANFHGTDSFSYRASDGELNSDIATVMLTVTPVNDPPDAQDDIASTAEDTPVTVPVLANDSDADLDAGAPFSEAFDDFLGTGFAPMPAAGQLDSDTWHVSGFNATNDLARGTADGAVDAGGIYAFTNVGTAGNTILGVQPTADDFTPGFIELRLRNDSGAMVETMNVSYDIWSYNDEVRANSLTFSYSLDGITFMPIAALDFATADAMDAAPVEWRQALRSVMGLAVDLAPGEAVILRWTGDDVSGSGARDQYGIDNVRAEFVAADTLTVTQVTQGAHGSVVANADGTVTYTPEADFYGTDGFTYTVSDGAGGTDTATVTVTVTPVNDAPVALGDAFTSTEDTPLVVPGPGVLGNDTDVDLDGLSASLAEAPAHGVVALNSNGGFTYTPAVNFHGGDSFTYTVSDGNGGSETATVSITVISVNDTPDAQNDSAGTAEDTPVNIPVLANDSDADPEARTVFVADFEGFLGNGLAPVPAPGQLDSDVWRAGGFSDVPELLFGGTAVIGDLARGMTSDPAVTGGIYAFTDVGTPGNTILGVQPGSDDFTPGFIELRLRNDGGAVVEAIDVSYDIWSYNDQGRANSLTFSYSLDGISFIPLGILDFITAEAVDGAPAWQQTLRSATGLDVDLAPGEQLILRWTGDDVSGSGARDEYGIDNVRVGFLTVNDGLAVTALTQGASGSVGVNADGSLTYVPNANFYGTDAFTYTVRDSAGASDTATVTVTVSPVNDAPSAQDDSAITAEDTQVSIPVLANDTDADIDPGAPFVEDFDDFLGTGFAPMPATGQLDSDIWRAGGFSGADDLARGNATGPVIDGGIYAFTGVGTAGNTILGVQPSGADFTPGFIELRVQNHSGAVVGSIDLSYEIWSYNDETRANSLDFSYSLDGINFTALAELDFATAEAPDSEPAWQQALRSVAGLGVELAPGEAVILRWTGNDVSGSGERDQYGIDNVRVEFAAADALTVAEVTQGANGSVTANADGTVTYTPNANFYGSDLFTYTVNDGAGGADTASVTVTVAPVNDVPDARDDSTTTAEDAPVTIPVLANDTDADLDAGAPFIEDFDDFLGAGFAPMPMPGQLDSDTWRAVGFNAAGDLARGTAAGAVEAGGIYAFTGVGAAGNTILGVQPGADDFTPGFIELRLRNESGAVVDAIDLSYEIWSYNDKARANSLNFSYSLDGISFTSVTTLDFVTAEAADALPAWQQTLRSVTGLNVDLAPGEQIVLRWAGDDVSGADQRDEYGLDNVRVDFVAAGTLAVAEVTHGANGDVMVNPDGTVTYTPKPDFHGTDTFTYTVSDGAGGTDTANVTVTVTPVNDAPVAQGDPYATAEDTPLVVSGPGVLGNDTDIDSMTLTAVLLSGPSHGTLALGAEGGFTYAPHANFYGSDSFTYRASDGALHSGIATVSLTVTPVNDAPEAQDDSASTAEDTPVNIPVLANDSDADPEARTVFVADFDDFLGTGFAPEPAGGQLDSDFWRAGGFSDAGDFARGSAMGAVVTGGIYAFTGVGAAGNTILGVQPAAEDFTPGFIELRLRNDSDVAVAMLDLSYEIWSYNDQTRSSSLGFSYSLDGVLFTSIASLDLVTAEASDGAAVAWQQTLRSFNGLDVDLAPGADIFLRWSGDDVAGSGARDQYGIDNVTVGFSAANEGLAVTALSQGANGSVSVNADNVVTYTPNGNFHGTDSFTYTVSDRAGASDTATVTVTVTQVNDAPVANDDAYSTNEDTPLVVTAPGVLGNDTDVDLDELGAALVSGPAHGTLTLNPDGSFTYAPAADFSGEDSFTYRALDSARGVSDLATVRITVNAQNQEPTLEGGEDQLVGLQKKSLGSASITLEGLFTDADLADTHTATIDWGDGSGVTAGTVDEAGGSITGTHSYEEVGIYTVTVTVRDSGGVEVSDTLTITVVDPAKNQVIRARSDRYQVAEGGTLQVAAPEGVLSNDSGTAGATLQARLVSGPQHGTLTFNADGSFSYAADAGFTGRDFFWYEINDGTNVSKAVKVWLVVAPVEVAQFDWTAYVASGRTAVPSLWQITWTQSLADWLARLTSAER